ncbi:hypothetical protein QZH41_004647 [Actinostola sp. cb2023]|nr:hypothetical protein QZH41_004647 [Actinostola sp. cb2023]
MLEGFYVDDLVTGGNDIEEVIQLYEKAKERMQSGGFKLRKWITNDEQVRGHITREEVGAQCEKGKDEISYAQTTVGVQMGSKGQKVLGLEWEREQDKIVFDLTAIHNKKTYMSQLEWDQPLEELLTSKTRVAPVKKLTIPRLELMSARILAQLMHTVKEALKSQKEIDKTTYWLDSMTALYWIMNRGEYNPADLGSRGVSASKLKASDLWWHGPQWLIQVEKEEQSTELGITRTVECAEEEKKATVGMVETSVDRGIQTVIDITKYSKYETVIRVTAWEWVKSTQNEMQGQENFKQLSKILQIVKDKEGILRCYGRMENAELDIDTREPIILSKNHKLTELIVQDCHVRVKHCGVRSTLAELRSKYWVPKGRQLIKRILDEAIVEEEDASCGLRYSYLDDTVWYNLDKQHTWNLRRFGLTRKLLTNIALQRSDWLRAQYRANIILYAPEMLIFVDETGCDKRLQRRYGYSFQGSQALIRRDFIRSPRISAIAAIGLDGPRAIKTFHESVNAEKFVKFLEYELLPILQPYNGINPDNVVIMAKHAPTDMAMVSANLSPVREAGLFFSALVKNGTFGGSSMDLKFVFGRTPGPHFCAIIDTVASLWDLGFLIPTDDMTHRRFRDSGLQLT